MRVEIPFGEWLPDLPARGNPGALEAKNVLPATLSYRPLRAQVAYTQAVPARVFTAFWAQDSTNTVNNFVGTATALYNLQANGAWNDATRTSGGAYSAADWAFAKFGDRVIAVAQNNNPQEFDMAVDTDFADLAGSPPQAARVAVIRDFIVLGDLQSNPSDIHWSGFFNSEQWSTTPEQTAQTQSDAQEIFGRGGRVQQIVGGEFGVVFLEHSIVRLRYEGPPRYFMLEEISVQRGAVAPNGVVNTGDDIFFYAHDGFWKMSARSGQMTAIGHNRVDDWFALTCDPSGLTSIRGAVDRRNKLVMWAFSTTGSTSSFDKLLIYNWASDRWSHADMVTTALADLASVGYNLDTIDTLLTNGIDIDSFPVDSPAFTGGQLTLSAFDSSNRATTFGGSPLVAEIDTREFNDLDLFDQPTGRRIFTRAARPIVMGSGATITTRVGHRDDLNASPTWRGAQSRNSIGETNDVVEARYQRIRVLVDGEFDHARSCEVDADLAGEV